MSKALVVIDVQKAMFDLAPHEGEAVVDRIAGLIARARAGGAPIFFVQHDGGPDDPFHAGKPGFPFHDRLTPLPGDDVTVKNHGSAFNRTDLDAKLKRAGVDRLVICGMQSEYCVDAAVRGAVERGYRVILVADGHSTVDSRVLKAGDIIAHQNETLGGSYAELVEAADIAF
ncbi:MAG: cysteine hydrolase [Alphaproteobacteria bacterium]|nr:cysteine hydrolase [Alphaproteobacteria bacterium]